MRQLGWHRSVPSQGVFVDSAVWGGPGTGRLSVPSASSWAKGHCWEALGDPAQFWAGLSGDRGE